MDINNRLLLQWGFRGKLNNDASVIITLSIAYSNNTYIILETTGIDASWNGTVRSGACYKYSNKTTTTFTLIQDTVVDCGGNWVTLGY